MKRLDSTAQVLQGWLDKPREGTHYQDRMSRLLRACQDCDVLWREERVTYRNGMSKTVRIDDVQSGGEVHDPANARVERYYLSVSPRVIGRVLGMRREFEVALNISGVTVGQEGGQVVVRVPKGGDPPTVTFTDAWRKAAMPQGALLLGLDEDGMQARLALDDRRPHMAVIGASGTGKSTLMRAMCLSALKLGQPVAILDTSDGFGKLSGWPGLVWRGGRFHKAGQCLDALRMLVRTMDNGTQQGRLYVFIDEVPDLIAQRREAQDAIMRLAQKGRQVGMFLVLGMQHPLSDVLGSATLPNISVRLVGHVTSKNAAFLATGMAETGAETLGMAGDFLCVSHGNATRFQAATAQAEIARLPYPEREGRLPPEVMTIMPTELGEPGRPTEPVAEWVVQDVIDWYLDHDAWPSLNWIHDHTKSEIGEGYGRPKQRRVLARAEERLRGLECDESSIPS